ncbi:hypothetical protein [Brevibacterium sediminis]|uniref:Uncharacterized protein n=1 Tax=Brevibacterium sediminis TaxID=1857024 RepID=A0ABQ1LS38_9MICO|nr:hypothetical protein [Brevibacterium sediminis]GGC28051.1 hypothetical protein GCM10010974_08230 [Brevibacterium sediminis]
MPSTVAATPGYAAVVHLYPQFADRVILQLADHPNRSFADRPKSSFADHWGGRSAVARIPVVKDCEPPLRRPADPRGCADRQTVDNTRIDSD